VIDASTNKIDNSATDLFEYCQTFSFTIPTGSLLRSTSL